MSWLLAAIITNPAVHYVTITNLVYSFQQFPKTCELAKRAILALLNFFEKTNEFSLFLVLTLDELLARVSVDWCKILSILSMPVGLLQFLCYTLTYMLFYFVNDWQHCGFLLGILSLSLSTCVFVRACLCVCCLTIFSKDKFQTEKIILNSYARNPKSS